MRTRLLTEDEKNHPSYRVFEDLLDIERCEFVIAGGSIHALVCDQNVFGDYDLFFFEYSQYEKMLIALMTMSMHNSGVVKKIAETKYAITFNVFGNSIQLIKTIFNVPGVQPDKETQIRSVFNSFDLSVCCYAIDENYLYYNPIYYTLSTPKNIIIQLQSVHNYARTLNRITKYVSRGCEIESNQFVSLIADMRNNHGKMNSSLDSYNFDKNELAPGYYSDLPF